MANPTGRGGFKPISDAELDALRRAAADSRNITYAMIARAAHLPKSTAIRYIAFLHLRPKGNFVGQRGVKQPVIVQRIAQRAQKMQAFVLEEMMHGRPVTANMLQRRYGGTKALAKKVFENIRRRF